MRTSWAFGGATSTSSMERGFPGSQATAALHLITWRQSTVLFIPTQCFYNEWLYSRHFDISKIKTIIVIIAGDRLNRCIRGDIYISLPAYIFIALLSGACIDVYSVLMIAEKQLLWIPLSVFLAWTCQNVCCATSPLRLCSVCDKSS